MAENQATQKKAASGWLNVAVDYGPLLVFFGVYKYWTRPMTRGCRGRIWR
jgi:intracellular septation protein